MKHFFIPLLMLVIGMSAQAQNISVKDFYYEEKDLTPRTNGTSVEDQNGNLCALIKVKTTEKGRWLFDVGMMGVRKTEFQNDLHPAEIWVYVPYGVLRISIQHEDFGSLDKWEFPCVINKGCTYVMVLDTRNPNEGGSGGKNNVRQQYLAFKITPPNATLEVNDKIWEVDADGFAQEFVDFGIYTYHIQALNYHSTVGIVTVDDADSTVFVSVALKPDYGWIEISGSSDLNGASVYVDNLLIGKAPCKSNTLKSGNHSVRIVKKLYQAYSETVIVGDNETVTLSPKLVPDYAEVTLKVDSNAEIWVNDEKKGVGSWTGRLGRGTYKMECKQTNHETSFISKEIVPEMNGQTIMLSAPVPIYGALNVESTPKLCQITIDGKDYGTTPKSINEILIGRHEVRLTKDGYADYFEIVTITKGERKLVATTMQPSKPTPITNPTTTNPATSKTTTVAKQSTISKKPRWGRHRKGYDIEWMTANANQIDVRINPEELSELNGHICFDVNCDIPAEFFDMKVVMNMTPVITYEGNEVELDAMNFVGEKGDRKQADFWVSYQQGGQYVKHYCINYSPGMEKGGLSVKTMFYVFDGRVYNTQIEIMKNKYFTRCKDRVFIQERFDKTFVVNGVSFTMELVEGMRQATKLNDYYMGKTEVTQALWKAVMNDNPSYFKGDELPVERVSWNDVQAFIRKLNQLTGETFRLPTEAEWEYAASGGKKPRDYYQSTGEGAWSVENSDNKTHAVKTKSANELGLYDMRGNVWEWCQDLFETKDDAKKNTKGSSGGSNRVLRGGSWCDNTRNCSVSSRIAGGPNDKENFIGFRLCRSR